MITKTSRLTRQNGRIFEAKTSEAEKVRAREREDSSERSRPKLQRCRHKKNIARTVEIHEYTNTARGRKRLTARKREANGGRKANGEREANDERKKDAKGKRHGKRE